MATFDKRVYQTWRISGKGLPQGQVTFRDEASASARRDELLSAGYADARVKVFKSVKWRVRIRLSGAPDLSRHFSTREKAEEWARAREGEIVKREAIDYRAADRHSLSDLLGMYDEKCLHGRGKDDPDKVRIRKLREHPVGQWRMSSLTAKAIADYRDQRLRLVKGSTVKKEIELISRVIAKARKEWGIHLPANVASGTLVARPEAQWGDERDRRLGAEFKPAQKLAERAAECAETATPRCKSPPEAFETDPVVEALLQMPQTEQQALLRACRYPHWFTRRKKVVAPATVRARLKAQQLSTQVRTRRSSGCRMWAIFSFALETAMRRGEMLKLCWTHVHLESGYLDLPGEITKNRKPRLVPLTLRARRILKTQPRTGVRVFATTVDAVKSAFRRARERVGIVDLRLHDARHEATSRLFEKTDLRANEIGYVTGHTDPRMLERYYNKRPQEFVNRFLMSFKPAKANMEAPSEAGGDFK